MQYLHGVSLLSCAGKLTRCFEELIHYRYRNKLVLTEAKTESADSKFFTAIQMSELRQMHITKR